LHEVDYVATGDFESSMHGSNGIDLVEGASIKVPTNLFIVYIFI